MSRTTSAYLQRPLFKVPGAPMRLFLVGPNWTRTSWRRDPVTGLYLAGAHLETAATNYRTYSNQIDQWSKGDAGDTDDVNGLAGPFNGLVRADGLIADSTDGNHHRYLPKQLTNSQWTYYVIARAGNKDHILLYDGQAGSGSYFDLANGVVGSSIGTVNDRGCEWLGAGWWMAWMNYLASAVATNLWLYSIETNGQLTFAGDGSTVNTWVEHAQVQEGRIPTSPIDTTTGNVARATDTELRWTTYVPEEFTAVFPICCLNHTPASNGQWLFIDDGTNQNRIELIIQGGTGYLWARTIIGGVQEATLVCPLKLTTGRIYAVALQYRRGRFAVAINGVQLGEAAGAHVPGMNALAIQPSAATSVMAAVQWRNEWKVGGLVQPATKMAA